MITKHDITWEEAKESGHYVFISHATNDKANLASMGLVEYLVSKRVHVAIDKPTHGILPKSEDHQKYVQHIPTGESWEVWIRELAENAATMIVLLSENYYDRLENQRDAKYEWCVEELRIGANDRKLLYTSYDPLLKVNANLINRVVTSAILPSEQYAVIDPASNDNRGEMNAIYLGIKKLFERSGNYKKIQHLISNDGKVLLLDLIAREEQCRLTLIETCNLIACYGDKSSHVERFIQRLAAIELPGSSSSERNPRTYRTKKVKADDDALQAHWEIKPFALTTDRGNEQHRQRLRNFQVSELLRFIKYETGIDVLDTLVGARQEVQKSDETPGFLINLQIEVNRYTLKMPLHLSTE